MTNQARTLLVCSCEDSMSLDPGAIGKACSNGTLKTARHLCRSQLHLFEAALGNSPALTVACTQESPLFSEIAEEAGFSGEIVFANIRETAGWSDEAAHAGPKMAALLAAAAEPMPGTALIPLESKGVALVYGRDEAAIELAKRLADRLDVTILLSRPGDVAPPRLNDMPVYRGTIRHASGYLGAFTLTVDDFAEADPSSRAALRFGQARNGAVSEADLVIDLSGGMPLFPAHELRLGYLRANPNDPAALERVLFEATGLVGTFDKPRYIHFNEGLCAHSRSNITGCTRCLELCPTGAITPNGDHVAISAEICAGCGACAAACPTGAAAYALPSSDALMRRIRSLLQTYRSAGGKDGILLLHDTMHGEPLIEALARFGNGLPAHVLPLAVNEVTQLGIECFAAAIAYGVGHIRILTRAKPKHDIGGLYRTVETIEHLAQGLGYGAARIATIETDDPDALRAALDAIAPAPTLAQPASLLPMGDKRSVLKQAMRALHEAAPAPVALVALPEKAPFGRVDINVEGCTLCLSCVSACPAGALLDNPEKPQLRFQEDACVQCGLCAATCPEKVISLEPRLNFAAINAPAITIKEEQPFHCEQCGKAFGTRSTIERVIAKLEGKHWMYSGEGANRIAMLRLCDDCRTIAVTRAGIDPHAGPERPRLRTTEDYLRERDGDGGSRP
jgi:ferredoxin